MTLRELDATLALWRSTRFEWGKTDCIMSVVDYVRERTGVDPAAPWRGSYSDEAGAREIYAAYGGIYRLAVHSMEMARIETGDAVAGAPVVAVFGEHEIAGLCTGERVAFRLERGVMEVPAHILGAWQCV